MLRGSSINENRSLENSTNESSNEVQMKIEILKIVNY